MRAGSSTILSMMSSTFPNGTHSPQDGGEVFSSFEPCTDGDEFIGKLQDMNLMWGKRGEEASRLCGEVVLGMSQCDFSSIKGLKHWMDVHSTNGRTATFKRSLAEKMCSESNFVAVKTVAPIRMENVSWVLHANPHLKVIEVVRDPRGMYASEAAVGNKSGTTLGFLCMRLAWNLHFEHPRLHRVVFEELVKDPRKVSKDVYEFLGRPWGQEQEDWVDGTFNAGCSKIENKRHPHFNDCHSDSAAAATSWKKTLPTAQKKEFHQNSDCVDVARAYKFDS